VDLFDPKDPTKVIRKAGEQLAGFGELRDDGTTRRLLDLLGQLDQAATDGAPRQRRPDGHRQHAELGLGLAGQPPRALQPRLLRRQRQAVQSEAQADRWNGKAWGGADVPDMAPRWRRKPGPARSS
jgi:formate dehydrogenase major subunit